eukprot:TRINITY_DN38551_c0_g1_i1.p1 TRINITY_DN38551_c0_g1~~TRINITY_DN38551_c0_g1_i1.p1  ORF type:complete len:386 (-),score=87.96 TRINITY_DN38551_c0_g1_i1:24-1181(-)
MKEESFVIQFKKRLLNTICKSWNDSSIQLIRKHDKNLEKGDFSFPNLSNEKVWGKLEVQTFDLVEISKSSPKIEKIETVGACSVVFLKRESVFTEFFLRNPIHSSNVETKPSIVNFDTGKPNSSKLTSARADSFHQALSNLNLSQSALYGISSTDVTSQIDNFSSDLVKVGVRVGAVLGKNEKKDEELDLSRYQTKVYEAVKQLDEERCDENEDIKDKEKRLATLTTAIIQFSFLGSNISNPVKIMTSNQNSNFVLYNSARIKKLLSTFDQHVKNKDYPPLPSSDQIGFGSLTEIEEWELLFNFLLPYCDILEECARTLSFHKLVNFLLSLATTYSRYYNRVKTLKDPLPHLVPIVHARVFLIKEVNNVFDDGLRILNLKPLLKM